jgi:clan AA aspartic protease (TIGR02281 family)
MFMQNRLCSIKNTKCWFFLIIGLFTVTFIANPVSAKIYKWKNEAGKTHYTDSPAKIPLQYRSKDKGTETVKEGPPDASNPVRIKLPDAVGRVIKIPLINDNNSFYAEVILNGRVKANLIVDTGASQIALSPKIAKLLGINSYANMPKVKTSTAGGIVPAHLLTLNSVQVGGAKARDVEAHIGHHMGELDGLLGMTFLGEFKVEVDRKASIMKLSSLNKRGEQVWSGKNAEWWKTRLGRYSKDAKGYSHNASYFKDNPVKSRENKRLSDYYHNLYNRLKDRAVRAGVPSQHIPPALRHD